MTRCVFYLNEPRDIQCLWFVLILNCLVVLAHNFPFFNETYENEFTFGWTSFSIYHHHCLTLLFPRILSWFAKMALYFWLQQWIPLNKTTHFLKEYSNSDWIQLGIFIGKQDFNVVKFMWKTFRDIIFAMCCSSYWFWKIFFPLFCFFPANCHVMLVEFFLPVVLFIREIKRNGKSVKVFFLWRPRISSPRRR